MIEGRVSLEKHSLIAQPPYQIDIRSRLDDIAMVDARKAITLTPALLVYCVRRSQTRVTSVRR